MSKQINIGGRIHSTEVGNVTTGANEVLDDTKGKKQNVINSETDAELLRLDQSKQNNLTFDNTPTENSTNPVTSGGVYAANITLHELIEAILVLIPSAASALNQLADKAFVNSSVSTATATFRGTYNVVTDLELAYDATHEQIATKLGQVIATADNNDYAFVQVPVSATSTDIRRTERYKFNGTAWGYEYDLNTSGFTAAQWEAINSGITALLVSKLTNLPTAEVLATMFAAKQNTLTFDTAPTALSTNPVTSGGLYSTIKAITDLIPAEATTTNLLADKAYVLASILAATPAFKGQFTSLADLLVVASPKAGDLGIVRTKDNDGKDVFTFYQFLNSQWNVYFSLSYHPQTKPATTGTTGDYPYNGMGRVELPMNIVGGVNTLTQSMMPTATGGNTVYVIKYDFTLGEDITIPANCILEFKGGSISGDGNDADTITGDNTTIDGNVSLDVLLSGTFTNEWFKSSWFPNKTIHQIADICRNFKYLEIDTTYTLSSVLDLTDIFNIRMDKDYITTTSDNYIKMGSTDGIGKLCQCSISAAGHITVIGGYNLDFNIGYCDTLKLQPINKNIGYSHFYLGTIVNFAIESNNYWVNSNIFNCARIVGNVTLRGNGNKYVSCNIFNDCVLENITMTFVKACSNRFYNTRMEGTSTAPNTITFDANCYDNVVEGLQKNGGVWPITGQLLQYTNVTNNGYDSNVVRYAPDNYNRIFNRLTSNMLDINPLVGVSKGSGGSFVSSGERPIAYINFEELDNKDFGFGIECDANGAVNYQVYLYDKYGNKLTSTDVPIDISLQSNVVWSGDHLAAASSTYIHAFCLMLSKNSTGAYVASAKVIVKIAYNSTIQYLNITTCTTGESSANAIVEIASPKYGADRPVVTDANIGFSMFDTSINKQIWYVGSNLWKDATGGTV